MMCRLTFVVLLVCTSASAEVTALDAAPFVTSTGTVNRNADAYGETIAVRGETVEHAIGMAAPASVTFKVGPTDRAFLARAAVDGSAGANLSMSFEVHLDGRRVGRTERLSGRVKPIDIAVDVTGAKTITLILHDQRDGSIGEHGVWLDPRLTTAPAPAQTDPRFVLDRSVQQRLFFKPEKADGPKWRPYYLSLPASLEELKAKDQKLPMVVFLHGIAEGGDDHRRLFIEAIPLYLRDRPSYTANHPYIFVCPQVPYKQRFRWNNNANYVIELIEHLRDTLPVDADRIYLTGLSDGGIGTWAIAQRRPDLFAAIAPVAARAVTPDTAGKTLKNVPAWIIVGGYDHDQRDDAQAMMRSYKVNGGVYHYRVVPKFGHVIWDQAYLDPAIYEWLTQWQRGGKRVAKVDKPVEKTDEQLGRQLLGQAAKLRDDGDLVGAYALYGRIRLEYTGEIRRDARRAIRELEDSSAFIEAARQASDEYSADAMLEIARRYLRDGETEKAQKALREVVDTWPLTRAAIKAGYLLK